MLNNNNQNTFFKQKLGLSFDLIVLLFWIGQIFASTEVVNSGIPSFFKPIQEIFNATPEIRGFFGFEVITFLIILLLWSRLRGYYQRQGWLIDFILFLTIACAILTYLNPNNDYSKGILNAITIKRGRVFLFFIPFYLSIMYLNKEAYTYVIRRFFIIGYKVVIVYAGIIFIGFTAGMGVKFFGYKVTTPQSDILQWFVIFQVLSFGLFLKEGDKKHLFISILLFLCLLFSYRRTGFLTAIFVDIGVYLTYIYISRKRTKAVVFGLILFIIIGIGFPVFYNTNKTVFNLTNRYAAALEFTGFVEVSATIGNEEEYTDMGHINQSMLTTEFFLNNYNIFWGTGLQRGTDTFWVEGRSMGGVHNSIVYLWSKLGLYMVFYYLFIILAVLVIFIRSILIRKAKTFYQFLFTICCIYLLGVFIAGWFSGGTFIDYVQNATQFTLLFSLIKLR